jgi:hypothetical protein
MSDKDEPERCPNCDRPIATEADWAESEGGGECDHWRSLCWQQDDCEPVPWRERALKAEKALATALRERDEAKP